MRSVARFSLRSRAPGDGRSYPLLAVSAGSSTSTKATKSSQELLSGIHGPSSKKGHDASPQSGLGVGRMLFSSSKKLRGLGPPQSRVRGYSPGYFEQAPSRGHEASPQSGLGMGCRVFSSIKQLPGLGVRAHARRICTSPSFFVVGVSSFLSPPPRSAMRRGTQPTQLFLLLEHSFQHTPSPLRGLAPCPIMAPA